MSQTKLLFLSKYLVTAIHTRPGFVSVVLQSLISSWNAFILGIQHSQQREKSRVIL